MAGRRVCNQRRHHEDTTSGHPDVGGIYHLIVRLILEPDHHFLGLTGLWEFSKKAVGSACRNDRIPFKLFEPTRIETISQANFA